ncbi:hypothetical protein RB596_001695 [Gaeumannomyces avenae]
MQPTLYLEVYDATKFIPTAASGSYHVSRDWRLRLQDGSSPRQHTPRWDARLGHGRRRWQPPPQSQDANDTPPLPPPPPPTQDQQSGSALMRLPAEIRLEIYRLAFSQVRFRWGFVPPNKPLHRGYSDGEFVTPDADLALLRVCKRMRGEIGDSWLEQVVFFAEDQTSLIHFLDRNPKTRRKIRRVVVREHPGGSPALSEDQHPGWRWDPLAALSRMGTTLDSVALPDALAALPGLRLDVLTVLSGGDPWNDYRTLDRFVTHGVGFRVLEFVTPHGLMLTRRALLAGTSRLCRPGVVVVPRALQPAGWDVKIRQRDGWDDGGGGAGVRLFRAAECGPPVGQQNSSSAEKASSVASCPRPFEVLNPALRTEWALPTTATLDGPDSVDGGGESAPWCELGRELLFVVRRGRGARGLRVPQGRKAVAGKRRPPLSWERRQLGFELWDGNDEEGDYDGGVGLGEEEDEEAEESDDEEEESNDDNDDDDDDDDAGEGPSSGQRLSLAKQRSATHAFLDNFRFMYPYHGPRMDALIGYNVIYSVTKDCWGDRPDELGTWGIFGEVEPYMAE